MDIARTWTAVLDVVEVRAGCPGPTRFVLTCSEMDYTEAFYRDEFRFAGSSPAGRKHEMDEISAVVGFGADVLHRVPVPAEYIAAHVAPWEGQTEV